MDDKNVDSSVHISVKVVGMAVVLKRRSVVGRVMFLSGFEQFTIIV